MLTEILCDTVIKETTRSIMVVIYIFPVMTKMARLTHFWSFCQQNYLCEFHTAWRARLQPLADHDVFYYTGRHHHQPRRLLVMFHTFALSASPALVMLPVGALPPCLCPTSYYVLVWRVSLICMIIRGLVRIAAPPALGHDIRYKLLCLVQGARKVKVERPHVFGTTKRIIDNLNLSTMPQTLFGSTRRWFGKRRQCEGVADA